MNYIGQPERHTQNRIVKLFTDVLNYEYLGNWDDRPNNQNIEEKYLRAFLQKQGYKEVLINRAIDKLRTKANNYNEKLYNNNKNAYSSLRFGEQVKEHTDDNYTTVHFIDWQQPKNNHFAIAEEVTVLGNREKRPDIVLYINGIAIGVLELKRSSVSIGEGIRQSITNQQKEFIEMKALLPNAVFIGFTGTPLLKKDKQTSLEVFGKYINTYKFNEAVEDEVVLDLMYEARNIEQRISSQERVDAWFENKTKTLNDFQKSELKRKWGTMQQVLSSRNRMQQDDRS